MNRDCKTCKFRSFKPDELSDNCGHHFEMDGVVYYDTPDLSACDKYGLCGFYEKDPDIMDDEQCISYLESICQLFIKGSKNCEGQALEYHQKYIRAIQYAISKIQKGNAE